MILGGLDLQHHLHTQQPGPTLLQHQQESVSPATRQMARWHPTANRTQSNAISDNHRCLLRLESGDSTGSSEVKTVGDHTLHADGMPHGDKQQPRLLFVPINGAI